MNIEEKKDLTSKIEVLIKNSIEESVLFNHDDIEIDPDGIDVIINTVVEALKKGEVTVKALAVDEHSKYVKENMIVSSAPNRSIFISGFTKGFNAALKFDEE